MKLTEQEHWEKQWGRVRIEGAKGKRYVFLEGGKLVL